MNIRETKLMVNKHELYCSSTIYSIEYIINMALYNVITYSTPVPKGKPI